jgi:pimeloyl-ACP methyl ester carboxylesterase
LLRGAALCRLGFIDVPNVHYVRNGDVALAYQVFGDGPVDLVYVPQWINNLEVAWSNPLHARFLTRLASFGRVVFVDRRGMGLSDRLSATDVPPLETLVDGRTRRRLKTALAMSATIEPRSCATSRWLELPAKGEGLVLSGVQPRSV